MNHADLVYDPVRFTELQVLSLVLDPESRPRIRALIESRWLAVPLYAKALDSALAWDREHPEPLTYSEWVMATATLTGLEPNHVGAELANCLYWPASPINLDTYARTLREAWERRTIGGIGREVYGESRNPLTKPGDLAGNLRTIGEVIRERHAEIISGPEAIAEEAMRSNAGQVPTGFQRIDVLLGGGLLPGDMCVVAGRTGMGKSAFAVDVTRHALQSRLPVAYVSLEMSPGQVEARLRAIACERMDVQIFRPRRAATVEAIHAACERIAEGGLALVVVDHVQLVKATSGRSRYEQMTEVSHAMKSLAIALEVPVMVLSQLSRQAVDREPELSDLRDSGALEEDADQVLLIHRPGYYDAAKDQTEAFAALAKHRSGSTGVCRLNWTAARATFTVPAPSSESFL